MSRVLVIKLLSRQNRHARPDAAGQQTDHFTRLTTWMGKASWPLWSRHSLTPCSLNASEQRELASRMEKKQLKEFMGVCLPGPLYLPTTAD